MKRKRVDDKKTVVKSYTGKTTPELKEILRARGLLVSGSKKELIARLTDNDKGQQGQTKLDTCFGRLTTTTTVIDLTSADDEIIVQGCKKRRVVE